VGCSFQEDNRIILSGLKHPVNDFFYKGKYKQLSCTQKWFSTIAKASVNTFAGKIPGYVMQTGREWAPGFPKRALPGEYLPVFPFQFFFTQIP
jgi:hypothetical protein